MLKERPPKFSRRDFLQKMGIAVAGLLTGCKLETVTPNSRKTPTIAVEAGMGLEAGGGGESLGDIVEGLGLQKSSIGRMFFEAKNPGCELLVAMDFGGKVLLAQNTLSFIDRDNKIWVLGNFNMPEPRPEKPQGPPVFNTPNFVNLIGTWGEEGNWFYRVPFIAGRERHLSAVYLRDGEYQEGLINIRTGELDKGSEKLYWQKMPGRAIQARMIKYENTAYVVFVDKDGKPMEEERVNLFDLPKVKIT